MEPQQTQVLRCFDVDSNSNLVTTFHFIRILNGHQMTREEKIVFLLLNGWLVHKWANPELQETFLRQLRLHRAERGKALPKIDLIDFEKDGTVLFREDYRIGSTDEKWYTVNNAFSEYENDQI